ncbi:DEAD/DEAH box helicase [Methanoregula sp. UBA64]|uniref:DEAD/DEAH box helicase n=1 Tax=Methanoregula sp. UBA64 TaxID=1915554 RepID=UPI0025D29D5A|nr:DEAD/DEAH box helicase [Methanoregula sp. UBA64]
MNFQEFRDILEPQLRYSLIQIDATGTQTLTEQGGVITHDSGPLQVIAGPGSGKTETLVLRTLKLIFVDNVNPKAIIITTFTEKAAKNLQDRILYLSNFIFLRHPQLQETINIYNLRIGTLHSLCADIMQEYRYPNYQNFRLMDDLEQFLFIFKHSALVRNLDNHFMPVFNQFDYLFAGYDPISGYTGWTNRQYSPNRWQRTRAAILLFNRITEDLIDVTRLQSEGGAWGLLYEAYNDYRNLLLQNSRCDFAVIQSIFLEFLRSDYGHRFINGDELNSQIHPGIRFVMVDEYQDTNPIQEGIYFELTRQSHNLCVVGDDDQSLYRFRGASVECMITFDQVCQQQWQISSTPRYLSINYRSHEKIVDYCDAYIRSFGEMRVPGARVANKPQLQHGSSITGNYPSVAYIEGKNIASLAQNFAHGIRYLLDNDIIQNENQCVLLMKSVKETAHNAAPFSNALRQVNIRPYNPRSRKFLEHEEIMVALGAFIQLVDPNLRGINGVSGGSQVKLNIRNMVLRWVNAYTNMQNSDNLKTYVQRSRQNILAFPVNTWINVSMGDIFYRIISREPFTHWKDDVERTYRLGKLSSLFEQYSSIPYIENPGTNRGQLRTSRTVGAGISYTWLSDFYNTFIGRLIYTGMNDPEDEELISPPNMLPIMTVHQAKGLEFDFVFVYGLNEDEDPTKEEIRLEDDFLPFRLSRPIIRNTAQQRSAQDLIRFYYVAFSRAKWTLIHLVLASHIKNQRRGIIGCNKSEFKRLVQKM